MGSGFGSSDNTWPYFSGDWLKEFSMEPIGSFKVLLFAPLFFSLLILLFFNGVNKEIKNETINGHFLIKGH